MIQNDRELEATRQRVEQFQDWLGQMRQNADPRDFEAMASGYRLEIERMQAEVVDYLLSLWAPRARNRSRDGQKAKLNTGDCSGMNKSAD